MGKINSHFFKRRMEYIRAVWTFTIIEFFSRMCETRRGRRVYLLFARVIFTHKILLFERFKIITVTKLETINETRGGKRIDQCGRFFSVFVYFWWTRTFSKFQIWLKTRHYHSRMQKHAVALTQCVPV